MIIPQSLLDLATEIKACGGSLYLVGGFVRDMLLGVSNSDFDCEVFGLDVDTLKEVISRFGRVDCVGESFSVFKAHLESSTTVVGDLKIGGIYAVDISLPRRDRLVGNGHKGFIVSADENMSPKEACRRRDATFNALLYNPLTQELLDFYGGQEDLKNGIIRAVDPETFVDDQLRVLRCAQFAARFNFTIKKETVKLCQSIDLSDLPAERLLGEFEKWLLSDHPSVGLKYFFELGIHKLFPVSKCVVFLALNDTKVVGVLGKAMDFQSSYDRYEKKSFRLAAQFLLLFNIFPSIRDYEKFLDVLKLYTIDGYDIRKKILQVVNNPNIPQTDIEIRRESTKKDLNLFFAVKIAENISQNLPCKELLLAASRAEDLNCMYEPLKPILMGQHVLDLGIPQGKRVGEICKAVFELQIEGKVNNLEEAINAAKSILK